MTTQAILLGVATLTLGVPGLALTAGWGIRADLKNISRLRGMSLLGCLFACLLNAVPRLMEANEPIVLIGTILGGATAALSCLLLAWPRRSE